LDAVSKTVAMLVKFMHQLFAILKPEEFTLTHTWPFDPINRNEDTHPNASTLPMQNIKFSRSLIAAFVFAIQALLLCTTNASASDNPDSGERYLIQPGDILLISVWKEENMSQPTVVRPDGRISFPLAGDVVAAGNSVENLQQQLTDKLEKYIPDPVLTVSVQKLLGNIIYVIGKVNRPGEFAIVRNIDVIQALSMAAGTSTYAALGKIKILRRNNDGTLQAIPFNYSDVEKGKRLEQNIMLKAGDVVVVP